MTLFKTIIIILVLLFLLAGIANFYYPQRIAGALNALTGQTASKPNETKCPDAVPVFCAAPTAKDELSLFEKAGKACRVFGTFAAGNFGNLENLMPEMSEEYKTKTANWIAEQKNAVFDLDFDSIAAVPLEGKTVFSDETNGQILILTNRIKIKDNVKKETVNENCLVNFRKNNEQWGIENIIFSKIE